MKSMPKKCIKAVILLLVFIVMLLIVPRILVRFADWTVIQDFYFGRIENRTEFDVQIDIYPVGFKISQRDTYSERSEKVLVLLTDLIIPVIAFVFSLYVFWFERKSQSIQIKNSQRDWLREKFCINEGQLVQLDDKAEDQDVEFFPLKQKDNNLDDPKQLYISFPQISPMPNTVDIYVEEVVVFLKSTTLLRRLGESELRCVPCEDVKMNSRNMCVNYAKENQGLINYLSNDSDEHVLLQIALKAQVVFSVHSNCTVWINYDIEKFLSDQQSLYRIKTTMCKLDN